MAMIEDAAAVLEDFIQDVSNLPAEMAHLFEEIQSKDKQMQDCRNTIADRDNQLQKFIRQNGSLVINPKEDEHSETITTHFDRAQVLQEEKVTLSDKAAVLLDRQLRRLDIKIRELIRQGIMPNDPPLPSILHPPSLSADGGIFSDFSSPNNTGVSTPLTTLMGTNGGGGGPAGITIANSNLARLAHPNATSNRGGVGTAQVPIPSQVGRSSASYFASSAPATPAAAAGIQIHQRQQQRESSAGAADAKRRRLLGSLPATSSALARHSSLGPGTNSTPRAGTPSSVRSGSAGPNKRTSGGGVGVNPAHKTAIASSSAAQQQIRRKLARPGQLAGGGGGSRRGSTPLSGVPKKSTTSMTNNKKQLGSVSDMDKDRIVFVGIDGTNDNEYANHRKYEDEGDEDDPANRRIAKAEDDDEDEEMMDPDSDDKRLYCTCRNVSYGNMVACDNDDCPYEWFHWSCVGVTKEPVGKWFCGECQVKLGTTNA